MMARVNRLFTLVRNTANTQPFSNRINCAEIVGH